MEGKSFARTALSTLNLRIFSTKIARGNGIFKKVMGRNNSLACVGDAIDQLAWHLLIMSQWEGADILTKDLSNSH